MPVASDPKTGDTHSLADGTSLPSAPEMSAPAKAQVLSEQPSRVKFVTRLRSILLKNLLILLAIELVVRAVAGLGFVALPPGGLMGADQVQHGPNAPVEKRLYQPDRNLILRMRPNFHFVYDRIAAYSGKKATYTVDTEAHGFRTPPFSDKKRPGVFRIICLGDSTTFGMNVEAEDSYPRVLARLLEEAYPGRFEVLNLGTVGYSSRQGIELLRREAVHYEPNLVTFAFGPNDRSWRRPLTDDALIRMNQSFMGGIVIGLREGLDHLYIYRLMKRGLAPLMQGAADTAQVNTGPIRVSLEGLRDAIVEAHTLLAKESAALIVLNTLFRENDARNGIEMGVQQSGAPYVNAGNLFKTLRRERTRLIEAMLNLPPVQVPPAMTLFRVQAPRGKNVILEWSWYSRKPVQVPMHDDGQQGDQRAGDGVWSQLVPGQSGGTIIYKYRESTPGGILPEFRDRVPAFTLREQSASPGNLGEIDRFGEVYLHSDSAHPDEEGHTIIAKALLARIVETDNVKVFLREK